MLQIAADSCFLFFRLVLCVLNKRGCFLRKPGIDTAQASRGMCTVEEGWASDVCLNFNAAPVLPGGK